MIYVYSTSMYPTSRLDFYLNFHPPTSGGKKKFFFLKKASVALPFLLLFFFLKNIIESPPYALYILFPLDFVFISEKRIYISMFSSGRKRRCESASDEVRFWDKLSVMYTFFFCFFLHKTSLACYYILFHYLSSP